jgi:hypothetical protein
LFPFESSGIAVPELYKIKRCPVHTQNPDRRY